MSVTAPHRKKLLVTGITGLLGSALAREASLREHLTLGVARHPEKASVPCDTLAADVSDPAAVFSLIETFRPDILIHAAAITSVDRCESEPEAAAAVNVGSTVHLLKALAGRRCRFIFISTDSVFDGKKGNYCEGDPTAPLHMYGRTKLEAERAILKSRPDASIIRTAFYGWNILPDNNSLAEWILNSLQEGKPFKGFVDLFFSPISSNHLAQLLLDVAEGDSAGVLHLAGSEGCSKYEFARQLASLFGYPENLVVPVENHAAKLKVKRPLNVTLSVAKAQRVLCRPLPNLIDGLRAFHALRQTVEIP